MPYGGDPQTNAHDAVRFLLADTSTAAPILTDNEVNFLIDTHSNTYFAASAGAKQIAAQKAGDVVDRKIGDFAERYGSVQGVSGHFFNLAEQYRLQGVRNGVKVGVGGISIDQKDSARTDTDWARSEIELGMHDVDGTGLVDGSTSGRAWF